MKKDPFVHEIEVFLKVKLTGIRKDIHYNAGVVFLLY
jgi:hypothetical protein